MLDEASTPPSNDVFADEPAVFYDVPETKQFNKFQWFCVGTLYLIAAFLLGFIIYISCTWNKIRINEYT
jgi:hypothetical protein